MLRRLHGLLLAAGLAAAPAAAHGPTPQQLSKDVVVDARAETLWALVSDPATIAEWHPDIASAAMEGEGPGARRLITFTDGGSVTDGIDAIDDQAMQIRWRLSAEDITAFPTSFYTNTVTLTAEGEATRVNWRASFFRADTTNEPAAEYGDEAAILAMEALVDHGLGGMQKAVAPGD